MDQRLQDLLDRDEIHRVMLRYCRGLDRLDNEMVRGCYWPEAIEDHSHYVGDVEGFIAYADNSTLMFESSQHGIMNHYCELDGDDAYTETYFQFSGVRAEPPHFISQGRYIDHFQKRDGEWRILNRVALVESQLDVPEAAMLSQIPSPYGPDETYPGTRDRNDVSYQRPLVPRRPKVQA